MDLLSTFDSLDLGSLQHWIATQRQEDLHLDFKLFMGAPEITRDDRKNFAKAVSGFANSDGGIVAWGIDCRKDALGVDAASSLVPVSGAAAVQSKLQSLTGEATSPSADGVLHRLIPSGNDLGYLLTLVPRSDAGPHMAMLGEGRYYKRSGSSFYQMEHFDIADMFGRRTKPALKVRLTPNTGPTAKTSKGSLSAEVEAVIGLTNAGRGIARFPLLKIKVEPPYRICVFELDGNGRSGLPILTQDPGQSGWRAYAGGADNVIHPDTTLDVTRIKARVQERSASLPDLVVDYVVAADGMSAHTGREHLSGLRFLELAKSAIEKTFPRNNPPAPHS